MRVSLYPSALYVRFLHHLPFHRFHINAHQSRQNRFPHPYPSHLASFCLECGAQAFKKHVKTGIRTDMIWVKVWSRTTTYHALLIHGLTSVLNELLSASSALTQLTECGAWIERGSERTSKIKRNWQTHSTHLNTFFTCRIPQHTELHLSTCRIVLVCRNIWWSDYIFPKRAKNASAFGPSKVLVVTEGASLKQNQIR